MLRYALALTLLTAAPSALACGSNSNCAGCAHGQTETAAVDVDAADGTKVTLAITGMSCGACSSKITAALNEHAGVNAVTVDHETGRARVAFDEATTNVDALVAAVAASGGFEAAPIEDAS